MDALLDAVDDGIDWAYKAVVPPSASVRQQQAHSEIRRSTQRLKNETDRSIRDEQALKIKMRAEVCRNENGSAKATAAAIVRGQASRAGLNMLQNRLSVLKSRLDAAKTTVSINAIIKDTTAAMSTITSSMGGQGLQRTVTNFERQNILIGNMAEIISDAVDGCDDTEQELDGQAMDERANEMVSMLIYEIHMSSLDPMPTPPTHRVDSYREMRPPPCKF